MKIALLGRGTVLAVVVSVCTVSGRAHAHAPGVDMGAFGTAVIDGVRSPGEWDNAAVMELGDHAFYVMNDNKNLYLAGRLDASFLFFSALTFWFDNDHDDVFFEPGDDNVQVGTDSGFFDLFRDPSFPPGETALDTDGGGRSDGAGAITNDGQSTFFEISHPLDSGDRGHDFSLHAGDTVGFIAGIANCPGGCLNFWLPVDAVNAVPPGGDIRIVADSNAPPTAVASPSFLWPPNHKLVPVSVSFDLPGRWAGAAIDLVSARSSDHDEHGHGGDDIQGAALGTPDTELFLRAERSHGDTRTYTLTYRLTALTGETTSVDATVDVAPPPRPPRHDPH